MGKHLPTTMFLASCLLLILDDGTAAIWAMGAAIFFQIARRDS